MTPPEDSRTAPAASGPLGLVLAVCAGILAAVSGLVATQEAADADPAQSGHRGRPQHIFDEEKPAALRRWHDERLLEPSVTAIREALDGMSGREGETFDALLRRWARRDPARAAEWAERLPDHSVRLTALQNVAIEWAATQPADAIEWATALVDPSLRESLLPVVAGETLRTDPVAALRVAVELPAGAEVDELIRRAAMEWASEDPAAAMAWAESISDEPLRQTVLAAELVAWSETEPTDAARRALESLTVGRLLDNTLVSIVQRWAQRDARAAAAWVERFPEGPLRDAAVENLLSQWRQSDPVAATSWHAGS